MIIYVTTEVAILPSRPLTPIEIYELAQPYAGKQVTMDVDPSMTVQQFADACDTQMGIHPSATVQERIIYQDADLTLNATLAESGVTDGSSVKYKFVLSA